MWFYIAIFEAIIIAGAAAIWWSIASPDGDESPQPDRNSDARLQHLFWL